LAEKKRRHIEREFGVPVAGEILDPSLWTQTALRKLPEASSLDWEGLFGRRTAPRILDLGCGNGRFVIGSSVWRPTCDHLGVDVLPMVVRYATRRANQRGLTNLRFAVLGAEVLLARYVEPGSIAEVHCYHPQPYDEPGKAHRRLVTPGFLSAVHRSLAPGGLFFVQTDHPGYWRYIREVASHFFSLYERIGTWPDAPKGRTRREIIALRRGLQVFRGSGPVRAEVTLEQAAALVGQLPAPTFEADHRLQALDVIERGQR
jgi:tRNA (guanine-N7-)-methyltransferase